MSSITPPWPSLYNPGLEILHIEHRPGVSPGGAYLYSADDIFRFTFYWTLIFYMPFFFICGFYAFCNYTFPPNRPSSKISAQSSDQSFDQDDSFDQEQVMPRNNNTYVPLQVLGSRRSQLNTRATPVSRITMQPPKKNERRSRVTFAVLIFLVFLALGLAGAVIGSAVLGFAAMGLFRAGKFNMSTWIPFLLAVIQVLVGLLSIWPSIIEII
ncbi:hypothetical protein NP233_g7771 [Leucocoprinus birnbaumii]|uniref:Uncharacterized protein n=1 Tax=Leucocoprinus birnbaumii TaxID=56174 RepID=A0AAD5VNN9_9AGAR|nr:hypothetical protein NP233_g7771 [Leucocoprinus birnbaumii]